MHKWSLPDDLRSAKRELRRRLSRSFSPTAERGKSYASTLFHSENVTALGIGSKAVAGKPTNELAVRIYVRKKLPPRVIGERAFPARLDGIPTDIVVSGPFRALGEGMAAARAFHRPVAPGTSIGFAHQNRVIAGTLGAVVERDGSLFYLSNNHVLAFENRLPLGSPIVQPGVLDGGIDPDERVGELAEFVPLAASGNRVDAAIAKVTGAAPVAQPFQDVRIMSAVPSPAVNQQSVHKFGRATGYTTGKIVDLAADLPIRFSNKSYRFDDQVLISGDTEPFASDGDSGAPVVEIDGGTPVAMLFAGSDEFSAANHLDDVMAALRVTIVI